MNNLDKFKLASSSFGEKLITSSTQMTQLIGTKVKEILQSPTPESKIVEDATCHTLTEPNWGLNLRICAMINGEQLNGTEIVKAIKKKIGSSNNKNVVGQKLGLELLEICCANCDKVFSEVASEKVLEEMVVMVRDVKTDERNRRKAVGMIRAWGESEELMYLPVFRQTYLSLKADGIPAGSHGGNSSPMHQTSESLTYEQPMPPPGRYPLPDMDLMGIEDDTSPYTYGIQPVEQKKELLLVGRNSLDLLSSILNSGMDPVPINDELTVSMLDKCKESLPVVQRIAETTTDDDILLFEALSLHDELEEIISRCAEIKAKVGPEPSKDDTVKPTETTASPHNVIITDTKPNNAEEPALTHEVKAKEGSETSLAHKDESTN
ncbi:ENTH/VHS, Target of Myb protein 1 [Artemisia annua]|nr:ENTH/VHS, Target of Myb protein 1 [Artemisia annua]